MYKKYIIYTFLFNIPFYLLFLLGLKFIFVVLKNKKTII